MINFGKPIDYYTDRRPEQSSLDWFGEQDELK